MKNHPKVWLMKIQIMNAKHYTTTFGFISLQLSRMNITQNCGFSNCFMRIMMKKQEL
jgi:hypothetical protein